MNLLISKHLSYDSDINRVFHSFFLDDLDLQLIFNFHYLLKFHFIVIFSEKNVQIKMTSDKKKIKEEVLYV